jgi:hypothetical protein
VTKTTKNDNDYEDEHSDGNMKTRKAKKKQQQTKKPVKKTG